MKIDHMDFEAIAALKHGHTGSAVVNRIEKMSRALYQLYMLSAGVTTLHALKNMRKPLAP